jgi:hypothetical protein
MKKIIFALLLSLGLTQVAPVVAMDATQVAPVSVKETAKRATKTSKGGKLAIAGTVAVVAAVTILASAYYFGGNGSLTQGKGERLMSGLNTVLNPFSHKYTTANTYQDVTDAKKPKDVKESDAFEAADFMAIADYNDSLVPEKGKVAVYKTAVFMDGDSDKANVLANAGVKGVTHVKVEALKADHAVVPGVPAMSIGKDILHVIAELVAVYGASELAYYVMKSEGSAKTLFGYLFLNKKPKSVAATEIK